MRELWDTVGQDLTLGLRMLVRNPGLTLAALATCALGIGANVTIFALAHGVLLSALPFEDPDRLVFVWNEYEGNPVHNAPPDYADRVRDSRTLESLAALNLTDANLTGAGDPVRVREGQVTAGFFDLLGVAPAIGRVFTPDEDEPGRDAVVVLGDGFWKRQFGSDPTVAGKSIVLDDTPHTILGVMPAGFELPLERVDVWRPISFAPAQFADDNRGSEYLWVLGRIAAGHDLESVRAEMKTIAAAVIERVPDRAEFLRRAHWSAAVVPFREQFVGDSRLALVLLLGGVGALLLIACANIGNLLLARGTARQREFAIRAALGASRNRLVRQSLTESTLLALIGGLIGLATVPWMIGLARASAPADLPFVEAARLDGMVLVFALVVSTLSGLLFGVAPAVRAAGSRLIGELRSSGPLAGGSRSRMRRALVIAEVALASVLLAGAGLLGRSFQQLIREPPGFEAKQRLLATMTLPGTRYDGPERQRAFQRELLERLGTLHGVRAVALSHNEPLSQPHTTSLKIEGRPVVPGEKPPGATYKIVSPGYFRTMGIPLLRGRDFAATDSTDSTRVAIVDARAAERFWPGENPLRKRIEAGQWFEVIGVAAPVKNRGLHQFGQEEIYFAQGQYPSNALTLIVHTTGEPTAFASAVRATVQRIDAEIPLYGVRALESQVTASIASYRYPMLLLSIFAAVGLSLAAIGIYGVISYSVRLRTREIGTRMALGASPQQIRKWILGEGMTLSATGLVVGMIGAAVLSRLIAAMLFETSTLDPLTFSIFPAVVVVTTAVACWIPARRATRIDPSEALRRDMGP